MKKQRHTEEQFAFLLKQLELGAPVQEVCRKIGSPSRPSTGGKTNTE